MWHVFACRCAGCSKLWLAVVDGDACFGLECSACGELRGRKISQREPFATEAEAVAYADRILTDLAIEAQTERMHYRNGREAKNGDEVVEINEKGQIKKAGTLIGATPINGDYCNGSIVVAGNASVAIMGACLIDCLHVDDVAVLLTEKGLEKRPPGK